MAEPLNCFQFEERLLEFTDGMLPADAATQMRRHAQQCGACGPMLEALHGVLEDLSDLPLLAEPDDLAKRILERTSGQRKALTWRATWESLWRPLWQPRAAMGFGMALFAMALLLNAAQVNLRQVRARDLTPTGLSTAISRRVNLARAGVIRYYNDLRVVYEIQAALHEMQRTGSESAPATEAPSAPSQKAPAAGVNQVFHDDGAVLAQWNGNARPGLELAGWERVSGRSESMGHRGPGECA
ncbi:MAG: anti-sigma factor family protein [Terriglobales bacterium]